MSAVLVIFAIVIACSLIMPLIGIFVCVALIILQIALIVIRESAAWTHAPSPLQTTNLERQTIFSVHVATHNEPPQMVINTLRALSRQNWPKPDYEVIVLDNNTDDPALWKPVKALCAKLGRPFRFFHEVGVRDAKAGALNIALARTRADATDIVTVDADYCVDDDFLTRAATALLRTQADYVQFPQAYIGSAVHGSGIDAELEEYFRTNARIADMSEAVLLTGTLCVISKAALMTAGGWSGRTTTEDAEMGVRLCRKGFAGRFIDKVVGRGFLPFTLRDLEQQRHRWTSGNLQTLMAHAPALLTTQTSMDWRKRASIVSQLSAWLNFSFLPAGVLLAALLTGLGSETLVGLAAISVLLTVADIVLRLTWRGVWDRSDPRVVLCAIANRLALAPISALATVQAALGRRMHFAVTDKFARRAARKSDVSPSALVLFVVSLMALTSALQHGPYVSAAILALLMPFPASMLTAMSLRQYRMHLPSASGGASP